TRHEHLSGQADLHHQRGIGDPGDPSPDVDDVRAPRPGRAQADIDEPPALLAARRDEVANHSEADPAALRQPGGRTVHHEIAEADSREPAHGPGRASRHRRFAARRLARRSAGGCGLLAEIFADRYAGGSGFTDSRRGTITDCAPVDKTRGPSYNPQ